LPVNSSKAVNRRFRAGFAQWLVQDGMEHKRFFFGRARHTAVQIFLTPKKPAAVMRLQYPSRPHNPSPANSSTRRLAGLTGFHMHR
jgi:hypothetical protein